jgi:hypothetical protein
MAVFAYLYVSTTYIQNCVENRTNSFHVINCNIKIEQEEHFVNYCYVVNCQRDGDVCKNYNVYQHAALYKIPTDNLEI